MTLSFSLQNHEIIHFCCFKPSSLCYKSNTYIYTYIYILFQILFPSVQFSRSVMLNSLQPHGLPGLPVHYQLPEPAWTHVHWVGDAIQPSHLVIPFSCLQSFPASGSFPVSQFFTSGGQSIGASASASVLQMNIQDWFPLRLTGLIASQFQGLSRVFSNTTVQKHQFLSAQLSFCSNSHIHTWLREKP